MYIHYKHTYHRAHTHVYTQIHYFKKIVYRKRKPVRRTPITLGWERTAAAATLLVEETCCSALLVITSKVKGCILLKTPNRGVGAPLKPLQPVLGPSQSAFPQWNSTLQFRNHFVTHSGM